MRQADKGNILATPPTNIVEDNDPQAQRQIENINNSILLVGKDQPISFGATKHSYSWRPTIIKNMLELSFQTYLTGIVPLRAPLVPESL